jgi:hypothetical protein
MWLTVTWRSCVFSIFTKSCCNYILHTADFFTTLVSPTYKLLFFIIGCSRHVISASKALNKPRLNKHTSCMKFFAFFRLQGLKLFLPCFVECPSHFYLFRLSCRTASWLVFMYYFPMFYPCPWTVLSCQITFLPVVPSAGFMLRPVQKMPYYFPETHHSTVSYYNQSNLISGALSLLAL